MFGLFSFCNFSLLQVRFLTIFSLLFCRCRSGLGSCFLPGNFRSLRKFAGPLFISLTFRLLQTLGFLSPPLISYFFCSSHLIGPLISLGLSFPPPPPPFFSFYDVGMAKTRGGSAFRPQVRRSSPPPAGGSSVAPPAAVEPAATPSTAQGSVVVGSFAAAPAPRRYYTRVGPTPPSPPHLRLARRGPSSKRARTSGPGESSSSRPQEP